MKLRLRTAQRPYHLVLSISAILCVIGIAGKLHFSSLGMWSSYNQTSNQIPGLIAGEPQWIRSDEWLLGVPWLLSQINSNPPLQARNISVGAESSALLVGLPVKHWSVLFRPTQWGFFIFSAERGFSWYWMSRTVACFTALTLFFLVLTEGSLLLSLGGALWIFFSSFTQWWLASVAELLLYFSTACVALRATFLAPHMGSAAIAGLLYGICAGGFALTLYPPFQIPLFYLGLCLLPLLLRGIRPSQTPQFWFRVVTLAVATGITLLAVVFFIRANADAVALMEKTVYPGQRRTVGGEILLEQYFSGFLGPLLTATRFPLNAANVCEASSFILVWPIALFSLWRRQGERSFLWRVSPLIAYLVLSAVWANLGIPVWLAHISGLELVPPQRGIIGWGIASVIFTILVVRFANASPSTWSWRSSLARSRKAMCALKPLTLCKDMVLLAIIIAVGVHFAPRVDLASKGLSVSSLLYLCVGLLALVAAILRCSYILLVASIIILCVYPHALVNPLMRGMSPVIDHPLAKAISNFDETRTARWIVFDSSGEAQLVKATGRRVLNGTQYVPNFWLMKQIDPSGAQQEIYNRYSHISFLVGAEGSQQSLHLAAQDGWFLRIDPCGEVFSRLQVDYIVLTQQHPENPLSCYEQVFQEKTISIYRRLVPS